MGDVDMGIGELDPRSLDLIRSVFVEDGQPDSNSTGVETIPKKDGPRVYHRAANFLRWQTKVAAAELHYLLKQKKEPQSLSDEELAEALAALTTLAKNRAYIDAEVSSFAARTIQYLENHGSTRLANILLTYGRYKQQKENRPTLEQYQAQSLALMAVIRVLLVQVRTQISKQPDKTELTSSLSRFESLKRMIAIVLLAPVVAVGFGVGKNRAEASDDEKPITQPLDLESINTDKAFESYCKTVEMAIQQNSDNISESELEHVAMLAQNFIGEFGFGSFLQEVETQLVIICGEYHIEPEAEVISQALEEVTRLAQKLGIDIENPGATSSTSRLTPDQRLEQRLADGVVNGGETDPQQSGVKILTLDGRVVTEAEARQLQSVLDSYPDAREAENVLVLEVIPGPNGGESFGNSARADAVVDSARQLAVFAYEQLNLRSGTTRHEIISYFNESTQEVVSALRVKSQVKLLDGQGNVYFEVGPETLIYYYVSPTTGEASFHYLDPNIIPNARVTLMNVGDLKASVGDNPVMQDLLSNIDESEVTMVLLGQTDLPLMVVSQEQSHWIGDNVVNDSGSNLEIYDSPTGGQSVGIFPNGSTIPVITQYLAEDLGLDLSNNAIYKVDPSGIIVTPTPGTNQESAERFAVITGDSRGLAKVGWVEVHPGLKLDSGHEMPAANSISAGTEALLFGQNEFAVVDSTIQQTIETTETITTATVKNDETRVRAETNTSSKVVTTLSANTQVIINSGQEQEVGGFTWYEVEISTSSGTIIGYMREDTLTVPETESQTATTTETVLNPELSSTLEQSAVLTQPSELVHPDLVSLMQNLPASRYQVTYEGQTYRVEPSVDQVLLDIDGSGERVAILVAELPLNGETVMVSLAQASLINDTSAGEWQLLAGVTEAALEPWEELNVSQEIYQLAIEWLADDDTPENIEAFIDAYNSLPLDLQTEILSNGAGIDFDSASGKFVDAETGNEVGAMTAEYQLSDEQFAAANRMVENFIEETINPDSMVGAMGGLPLVVASTQETGIGYERNQFTDRFFLLAYAQLIYVQLRLNGENPDINNILQNLEQNGIADYQDLVVTISNTKEVLGQIPLGDLSIVVVNVDDFRTLNNLVDDGDILTYENWRSVMRFNPASGQLVIMEAVDIDNILGPKASATQLTSVRSMSNIMQLINFPIIGADKRGDNDYVRQIGEGGAALLYYDYGLSILAEGMFPVSIVPLEN